MIQLTTKRLVLEPLGTAHAEVMYESLQDERIYEYIPDEPPTDLASLRERYSFLSQGKSGDGKEEWLNWIAFPTGEAVPCGTVQASVRDGKDADVAFVFFPRFWRQGYGSEATAAMIDFILPHYKLCKVSAYIDTRNVSSLRMVERLGFRRVRTIKDADVFKGHSSDEHVYEIDVQEWA